MILIVNTYYLSDLCKLKKSIINAEHLKIYQDNSTSKNCTGPFESIINANTVEGPFFAACLNSGLVRIQSDNEYDISNAFFKQKGGNIKVGKIKGIDILEDKTGGIFEGTIVYGNYFGNGMKGGISKLNSIYGDGPFKNIKGGVVLLNICYGNNSFQGMTSGIAFIREFKTKYENRIGEHDGGTIITTSCSLSGDKALDKSILEGAVVFEGSKASQRWKSFSDYLLKMKPEWLAGMYNKAVFECNFRNPYISSESLDDDLFQETLGWTVPVNLDKENSGEVIIGDLLIKFNDGFDLDYLPKFYKDNNLSKDVSEMKKIGDMMRSISASARKLRFSADEPILEKGYRGRLKVDNMSNKEIFNTLFKGGTMQQTLS